jgi:ribosomal protein S18 acetylase RimI-like enzyme
VSIRLAVEADAPRLAELHAARITEGFLPTLGPDFLTRLYRRIARSPGAFAEVTTADGDPTVAGFAAAAIDTGRLYREFVRHDGVSAGLRAAPRLLRSWRRALETLRYPASATDLPAAEILAVAVDECAGGRGLGRALVDAATAELHARGVDRVKVVVGADNAIARRMYSACGFAVADRLELHEGAVSEVLVWNSSSD